VQPGLGEQDLAQVLEEANSNIEEFGANTQRFQDLRRRLQEEGVQLVFNGQAAEGADESTGSETDE
jgi:hypothetical protein